MLRSADRQLVTDVSGQPIGPIFRGQAVQDCLDRLAPALIPEKRRPEILGICLNMPLRRGTHFVVSNYNDLILKFLLMYLMK